MPHLVQPPHGVAVSLSLYAIFFAMLAQSDFAVAVTGQVSLKGPGISRLFLIFRHEFYCFLVVGFCCALERWPWALPMS
jgi:hypothetical protein